jgi:ATP-dependent exoDNAse (exonuclease V) beta subunit
VQGLYEEEEVKEEMDPLSFGLILHETMESIYKNHIETHGQLVEKTDLDDLEKKIDVLIDKAFSKQFSHGSGVKFDFTGQHAIGREMIKKMALKVIDFDREYAPFEIMGLEEAFRYDAKSLTDSRIPINANINGRESEVYLGGFIDRIDMKNDVIRVLDYKTGIDEKKFASIQSLFDRENEKRNKAAFQTFFYGSLYMRQKNIQDFVVQAGLFNIRELFKTGFNFLLIDSGEEKNHKKVEDITPYMEDFMLNLRVLIEEIFDPAIAFDQTSDHKKCQYCPYIGICNR